MGKERTRECGEAEDFYSEHLGLHFFFKGAYLLLYLLDYSRALMVSPDHERNAHHEVCLEN